jgi:hypothetical protein
MRRNKEVYDLSLPIYSSQRTELRDTLKKLILDIENKNIIKRNNQ